MCDGVIEPLLERVLSGAGDSTALLYGQTGAGKTHTLTSLLERVALRLDEHAAAAAVDGSDGADGAGGVGGVGAEVRVHFFEVASKGCMDLMHERAKVSLRSDENDVVRVCGARTCVVTSGAALRATLAEGLALRSTVQTQANPISSRSHAICELEFGASGRVLRLVDLAGSERNCEPRPFPRPPSESAPRTTTTTAH